MGIGFPEEYHVLRCPQVFVEYWKANYGETITGFEDWNGQLCCPNKNHATELCSKMHDSLTHNAKECRWLIFSDQDTLNQFNEYFGELLKQKINLAFFPDPFSYLPKDHYALYSQELFISYWYRYTKEIITKFAGFTSNSYNK